MKKCLIIILILCSYFRLGAQNSETDSTLLSLKSLCFDSLLTPSYFQIQQLFEESADASDNIDMIISARNAAVYRYYLLGETDSLRVATEKMKIVSNKYNDSISYYTSWSLLLNNYILTGKTEQAITEAKIMEEEAREKKSHFGLATSMTSAGEAYLYLGLFEEAVSMFEFSLKEMDYMTYHDNHTLCNIYYSLILANTNLQNYSKVFEYCNAIDSISFYDYANTENITNISYLLVSSCGRVIANSKLGNLDKAFEAMKKAKEYYEICSTQQDYYLEAQGVYYEASGNYKKAIESYKQATKYFNSIGLLKEQNRFIREQAEVLELSGNYKEACQNYSKYIKTNDSLVNANTFRQLNEFVVLHDLNGIELEKKNLQLEIEHNRQRSTTIISITLIVILIIVILFLISERRLNNKLKKSEKKMKIAMEKAEQSDKLKSAFLANMSHEIRTPLNSIVGFSALIAESRDKEEQNSFKEIIKMNSDVLLKLVNDVLDLSKIEAGVVDLNYKEFDLVALMNNLYSSFLLKNKNKEVQLVLDSPYPICRVIFDSLRISQLFTNFVTNSMKFTPSGTIVMGYKAEKKGINLYVSDTGIGISDDLKDKVFERFFKISDFSQGNGLGMAISKAITDAAGGTISVDSKEGEGSTFRVWLPCKVFLS